MQALAGALLLTLSACGGSSDGGTDGFVPTDGTPLPSYQLTTEQSPKRSLIFSEQTALTVRYADENGDALSGAAVQFALVGRAHDSSLSDVAKNTDANGLVSIALTAGTAPSVFQVRVSAERATPLLFDVAVSDAGFGSLIVRAEGSETRDVVSHRISLFTEVSCETDGLDLLPADRVETTDALARDLSVTRLDELAAGLAFTVRVEALDAEGRRLELGCQEASATVSEADVAVDVRLAPLPLSTVGRYDFDVEVSSADAGEFARETLVQAAEETLIASGGAATTLLDTLEQYLRNSGELAAANALQAQRVGADVDGALEAELAKSDKGPLAAIAARGLDVARAFDDLAFNGSWTAGSSAPGPTPLDVTEVRAAASTPGALTLDTADLINRNLSYVQLGAATNEALDVFEGSSVHIGASIGGVAHAFLRASIPSSAREPHQIFSGDGCGAFVLWVSSQGSVNTVCDADCARSACIVALSDAAAAAFTALDSPVFTGQMLSLHGDIAATSDGPNAGTLIGNVDGTWHPALSPEPSYTATGNLSAARNAL